MPAADHPLFRPPENRIVKIWRYMDFTKFVSMLENQGLFFCRADKLGDPFEASFPKQNRETLAAFKAELLTKFSIPLTALDHLDMVHRAYRKWTTVCCWHMNDHESVAMWSQYTKTNEAIAVCSTYERLRNCLDETCFLGTIAYIDYEKDQIPEGNMLYPYLFKRWSYKHEHELRAVHYKHPPTNSQTGMLDFDAEPPYSGEWKPVDLNLLIDEIRVAPNAPAWFRDLTEHLLAKYSLTKQARQSDLDKAPFV